MRFFIALLSLSLLACEKPAPNVPRFQHSDARNDPMRAPVLVSKDWASEERQLAMFEEPSFSAPENAGVEGYRCLLHRELHALVVRVIKTPEGVFVFGKTSYGLLRFNKAWKARLTDSQWVQLSRSIDESGFSKLPPSHLTYCDGECVGWLLEGSRGGRRHAAVRINPAADSALRKGCTQILGLAGVRLVEGRWSAPPEVSSKARDPKGWVGLSGVAYGFYSPATSINQALADSGYTTMGPGYHATGYSVEGGGHRVRFALEVVRGGDRSFRRRDDCAAFGLSSRMVAATFGYDVLTTQKYWGDVLDPRSRFVYRSLSVYPLVGVAFGETRVDLDPSDPPFASEQLALTPQSRWLLRPSWLAMSAIGADHQMALLGDLGLRFDIRVGYAKQFYQGDWHHDDSELTSVSGGPAVDMSSPFVRASAGVVSFMP